MKNCITIALIFISAIPVSAQKPADSMSWYANMNEPADNHSPELMYDVHGVYSQRVTKSVLTSANKLNDFIPDYPYHWITDYISTEISGTRDGKPFRYVNKNNILSSEQKAVLRSADLASVLNVTVKYKYANSATGEIEERQMFVSLTIVPEVEADFAGGYQSMMNYFRKNAITKISGDKRSFQHAVFSFTVNEEGSIINPRVASTTGDPATDRMLLDAIGKMPKWKPAQISNGAKVKQEFEFHIGYEGC